MNLILHKLLAEQDLEIWARLKKDFFQPPYTEIYHLINRFYQKFDKLPSFEELELVTRDEKHANYITALKELTVPEDLDIEILLQALINEYAQRDLLQQLSRYLDDIVFKDVGEMVEDLSDIAIDIEEKTEVSEQIVEMNDFMTIDNDAIFSRVPLGLNNDFDQQSLGATPGEMFMIGGYRKVRAEMTEDNAYDLWERFTKDGNFLEFERQLMSRPLKRDNRIITIDNSNLTIANIDATIHTYKNMLDDKLKVVAVDYINQITSHDPYNWQVQIEHSKKLKALARKYDIVMLTPYQISEDGKVRFSKGILDSPDWAFNLSTVTDSEVGAIEFECKKSRGDQAISFASEIHWPTLKILSHKNVEFMKSKVTGKAKEMPAESTGDDLKA